MAIGGEAAVAFGGDCEQRKTVYVRMRAPARPEVAHA
jgi:hypothetical protein